VIVKPPFLTKVFSQPDDNYVIILGNILRHLFSFEDLAHFMRPPKTTQ
jgi:hypothetical protein